MSCIIYGGTNQRFVSAHATRVKRYSGDVNHGWAGSM